ncbi:MAG: NifB/NifX family molybdenum-iron cluster-binding protein [Burkholderiaceae bacterium]|nr:NifB/NifX family molybdenum-iron cluster-binding protein [Burkholderiaceae bacterium]
MRVRRFLTKVLLTLAAISSAGTGLAAGPYIAVAAKGPGAQAAVSTVAARAPQILIFDGEGRFVAAHSNPVAARPGGAGPALAQWLADHQVALFIAGDVGDKMAPELQRLKIRSIVASGPADRAVKAAAK